MNTFRSYAVKKDFLKTNYFTRPRKALRPSHHSGTLEKTLARLLCRLHVMIKSKYGKRSVIEQT